MAHAYLSTAMKSLCFVLLKIVLVAQFNHHRCASFANMDIVFGMDSVGRKYNSPMMKIVLQDLILLCAECAQTTLLLW